MPWDGTEPVSYTHLHYRLREQYPTFETDASGGGWKPDGRGNYTRTYNGITQTLPESLLASQLQEQKQATQLSSPVQDVYKRQCWG